MSPSETFFGIMDAPLQELYRIREAGVENPVHSIYVETLISYFAGDSEALEKAIEQLRELSVRAKGSELGEEASQALALAELRLQIRKREVSSKKLLEILRKVDSQVSVLSHWNGEAFCLVARACEVLERHDQAMRYYRQAHRIFEEQGCRKKSVRSLMNHLASKSRLEPQGNYISEYFEIVRLARKAEEYGMAGVALMNISRELQATGALPSALKYANRAVMYMSRDVGTLHYYLALAHRSHLYLDLGRAAEARADLENARLSGHREIQAAVLHLESRLENSSSSVSPASGDLTYGWRARIAMERVLNAALGAMEDELIRLLSTGPRTKAELMALLWGEGADSLSLDFRFKDLVKRVRRKRADLIIFDGERYRLSFKSFIEVGAEARKSG